MTTCNEQDCDGPIDGTEYCGRCGTKYQPPQLRTPDPPTAPEPDGADRSRGRRSLPPLEGTDPRDAVLADAVVPERKRFCRNPKCRQPVGRAKGDRPGRAEGFCQDCGWGFSFRPPLDPRTTVSGRYEVEAPIGRGGLGWVYLAVDRKVDRFVVLKGLVDPDDPTGRQVALDELRALGQANHPNIVGVYDAVQHPYQLPGPGHAMLPIDYIVMEHIQGRSLMQLYREHRDRDEYLPVDEVCGYILQALAALSHLHHRRLLYNDFSPDNVISAEDGRVRLIDLGGVSVENDLQGGTWGKEGYRDTRNPPSVQTDLHAVARTMAVLTFRVPGFADPAKGFPDPATEPLLARHESYRLFLLRATDPDPEHRFGSAEEMAGQLEAVQREVRACDEEQPHPGLSDVFGPELRVVGADPDLFPAGPVDRVAAALALPDPQVDPADPQARRLTSLSAENPQELLEALAGLQEMSLETRLRAVRARVELAAAGSTNGELDTLTRELAGLRAEKPDDVRVAWFRGLAALVDGSLSAARAEFTTVLHALPGEVAPKLALALCAELLAEHAIAERFYATVWRTDESYVSAAFGLARTRIALGNRAGAADALGRVPTSSRYAVAATLCALVAAEPGHGSERDLAPGFFTTAERLREAHPESLEVDDRRRYLAFAAVLTAASTWVRRGRPWPADPTTPEPSTLLGFPLDERGLQDGLEWTYRQLAAKSATTPAEKIKYVDRANRERNWSLR